MSAIDELLEIRKTDSCLNLKFLIGEVRSQQTQRRIEIKTYERWEFVKPSRWMKIF